MTMNMGDFVRIMILVTIFKTLLSFIELSDFNKFIFIRKLLKCVLSNKYNFIRNKISNSKIYLIFEIVSSKKILQLSQNCPYITFVLFIQNFCNCSASCKFSH